MIERPYYTRRVRRAYFATAMMRFAGVGMRLWLARLQDLRRFDGLVRWAASDGRLATWARHARVESGVYWLVQPMYV